MRRLVLIVNADDYGRTPSINRGIEQAHLEGIVTSTTVMANLPAAAHAAGLGERCPGLGVGIHLTLTLGSPVAPVETVETLVDDDGQFFRRPALLDRLRAGLLETADVATECAAQLSALRGLGVEPDHWDVHQHLQEYAGLGEAIVAAMRDGGVLRARNPARAESGLRRLDPAGALRARRRAPCARLIGEVFATPDGLLDARLPHWASRIDRLAGGVIETLCHPAQPGERLGNSTLTAEMRAAELGALCDLGLRRRLDSAGVSLASFPAALDGRPGPLRRATGGHGPPAS